jgi:ubiquinone/menaquinone biosynthesis C-methylase UbiE
MAQQENTSAPTIIEFGNVDASNDPNYFVDYLEHTRHSTDLQTIKQRSYALLKVEAGMQMLDVGCGLGDDVYALAQFVGPQGRVVGIDNSQKLLDEAAKNPLRETLPVEFVLGDGQRLPFEDGTFDACRTERVLQHCEDPALMVTEMARVVRPGSLVQAIDIDFDTAITHFQDVELSRKLTKVRFELVRNGWIGRRLTSLFQYADLTDIHVEAHVVCITDVNAMNVTDWIRTGKRHGLLTKDEAEAMMHDLLLTKNLNQYFDFFVFFTVVGRKP